MIYCSAVICLPFCSIFFVLFGVGKNREKLADQVAFSMDILQINSDMKINTMNVTEVLSE